MSEFSFGQAFQNEMLALMIRDHGFATKAAKYVPTERLYSDSHKYLFGLLKNKLDKENKISSFLEVEDNLKRVERSRRRLLKAFASKIYSLVPTDSEYIKDSLTEYSKKTVFVDIFQSAQTLWNTGKHDETYKFTLKGINELFSISFRDDINVAIEHFEDYRQAFIEEAATVHRKIPTGIEVLDGILSGGLAKTQLGIILADTKVGKSIGLVHMGSIALMMRTANVAHFILEGSTEETMMRYQSRLSGIPHKRILNDELSEEEEKLLVNIEKRYFGRLELIPFNTRYDYTIQDIEAKILEMERRGKYPDLVIVDYGDLLSVGEADKRMEFRHQQTAVFRGLKQLPMIYKVALWTASQTSKPQTDPEKETLIRARNIAESYEKVRITDLLITLNQTPREKEMGLMRILVDLYRHDESDRIIRVIQDFSRMIFYSKRLGYIKAIDRPSWKTTTKRGRK